MPQFMTKPKARCPGASCPGCSSADCYATGGGVSEDRHQYERGVNQPLTENSGTSQTRSPYTPDLKEAGKEWAKKKHEKVLSELKMMPKPKLYAEGGSVSSATKREDNEKGVHQPLWNHEPGVSAMGRHVRAAAGTSDEFDKADSYGAAKKSLNRTHAEARTMPKPQGHFAIGGEVEGEHEGHEDMDADLHGAMGEELMSALESKDKKRIMESLEAIVMSCMDKE